MIRVRIEVTHAGGEVEIVETDPVLHISDEGAVSRALDTAVRRAHVRAKAALINPTEVTD
jgi:hypothetical protein